MPQLQNKLRHKLINFYLKKFDLFPISCQFTVANGFFIGIPL